MWPALNEDDGWQTESHSSTTKRKTMSVTTQHAKRTQSLECASRQHNTNLNPNPPRWQAFNEDDCWRVFTQPGHSVADVVALARATDWQLRPVNSDSGGGATPQLEGDVFDLHA